MTPDESSTPVWVASSPSNSSDIISDIFLEETIPVGTAVFQLILGSFIILGNGFVIVVLRHGSTLSGITRFLLGNLAAADIIFGGCAIARGIFTLAKYEARYFCAHVIGLGILGLVATFGTASVITANFLYFAAKGPGYRDATAKKYICASQSAVWLLSITFYGIIFLFLSDSEVTDCTASSGYIHRIYYQMSAVLFICLITFSLVGQVSGGVLLYKLLDQMHVIAPVMISSISTNVRTDESLHSDQATEEDSVRQKTKQTRRVKIIISPPLDELQNESATASIRSTETTGSSSKRRSKRKLGHIRQKRHTFVIIAMVFVCLFVCTVPFLTVHTLNAFAPQALGNRFSKLPSAATTVALLNSLMNVVIYFIKDKDFRQQSKYIFKRMVCQ